MKGLQTGPHSKFCFNLFNLLIFSKNEQKKMLVSSLKDGISSNFFLSKKIFLTT